MPGWRDGGNEGGLSERRTQVGPERGGAGGSLHSCYATECPLYFTSLTYPPGHSTWSSVKTLRVFGSLYMMSNGSPGRGQPRYCTVLD